MPFAKPGRPGPVIIGLGGAMLVGSVMVPALAHAGGPSTGEWPPGVAPPISAGLPADTAGWTPASFDNDPPFFDFDWSMGLRGSYIKDDTGDRYQEQILPSVTVSHTAKFLSYHATADGQLSKTNGGSINIDQGRLSAGSVLAFDPNANLTSNASVSINQEDPHAADVASDVLETPVEYSGSADTTFVRKFGRVTTTLTGNLGRDTFGFTTLTDGTLVDNSSENNTHGGGGLRVGYALSPIVGVFAEGDVTRSIYDIASPSLGTKLDGNLYTVTGGLTGNWDDILTASASIGFGLEHFDSSALADVRATLYDANLTFKPDDTLTLVGDFATTIGAPGTDGSGTAKIDYAATGTAAYVVNPWLTWRGSAGWHSASYADSTGTDDGYDLGVGADYLISRHAKLSADYSFDRDTVSPSPTVNTHTVSLGVTFQK